MDDNYYPNLSPLTTGLAGKCPRCGRGKLFDGYLSVATSCQSCGLSYSFADSGRRGRMVRHALYLHRGRGLDPGN